MEEIAYTLLFEPSAEGGYIVTSPALPGLVIEAGTFEEARAMAKEAIRARREERGQAGE